MAEIRYTYKQTKRGLMGKATCELKCGHTVEEQFLGRTESDLERALEGIIQATIRGHIKNCKKYYQ